MSLVTISSSIRLAAVSALVYTADPGSALRVLRASPVGTAAPTAPVTVTFDRPVAGSLDRTVDPSAILAIVPAVTGRAEWRDPVTLRFRPDAPLASDTRYTVTVSTGFAAMDGSRLAEPYRFSFRVRGPRVLAGAPVGPHRREEFVTPRSAFEIVVDAPLDSAVVPRSVYLEFDRSCAAPGAIRLRLADQRPIRDDDRWEFREAGGWDRDRAADSLRRVARLVPERPLPRGCAGHLVLPSSFDDEGRAERIRWGFATYGDFTLRGARGCWGGHFCPSGPLVVRFSTPVRGADVLRYVTLRPAVPFTIADTADTRPVWALDGRFMPRTGYAVVADTALRDIFEQRLTGNPVTVAQTTGFAPAVSYDFGRAVVERRGFRTFPVRHVNVDSLEVILVPVPDSLEDDLMGRSEWQWRELWARLAAGAAPRRMPVATARDQIRIYGLPLPAPDASRGDPTLLALQVSSPGLDSASRVTQPIALLQVTDLGVHARIGAADGAVWVTGASDGQPRAGAEVTLHDRAGRVLARAVTDREGLARLDGYRAPDQDPTEPWSSFEGYVAVRLGADRALVPVSRYDPDLSPWRFNVSAAWGPGRVPVAGAVFTERGIYRPGEPLHAKVIARTGPLGTLTAPARGDSLRWIFHDRRDETGEAGTLRDTTVALSPFGTADQTFDVPTNAAPGDYELVTRLKRDGRWTDLATTRYRVAEYRPPEFLVDVTAADTPRLAGDTLRATVEARYLFGAPMARAAVRWTARRQGVGSWELEIPNTDGYYLAESGWWYEELSEGRPGVEVTATVVDTLDEHGRLAVEVPALPAADARGRPSRVTLEATVTDVNRQTVSASASALVHPAAFYIGAKPRGASYFWTAGRPVEVEVIAVRPDGRRVSGVAVRGTVVRREWHQVRRERNGYAELVGEWVADTVARCNGTSAAEPAVCRFTPPAGGTYSVAFQAADPAGRIAHTSFQRWAIGRDWVPWNDESQFKMDVIPDRTRYTVGDTATILFASPFTDAEAWVTVEREGIIEQRRMRITSGTTTLRLPITEALAPNVFVSILVARGRSAAPGALDDPGRPTIRVGYAELRVAPERKRLTVELAAARTEYRPGDTARVTIRVRDAAGRGQRSEVTLWAVDEGVLSLTGYRTPDPIDLLYRPRGLGPRLASNLTTVASQIPEGQKGRRAPGGGGGAESADILRSRFQTTAFFLGSVVTDAEGRAVAAAKLPDNLTTFRLMAVAVTAGDRYGSGQAPLLVTRPLVARPALPRFVREGDRFTAGVVVNHRLGGTPMVQVEAEARGARIDGPKSRRERLEAGRGREVRFAFQAPAPGRAGDSVRFRFRAASGREADAVEAGIPVRPSYRPRAYTLAGVLHDTATVVLQLPDDLDPERSRLTLELGTSPLPMIRGAERWLRIYPYWCTEQLTSAAQPLIALYRAGPELGADSLLTDARRRIEQVVAVLERRQRSDGGIGSWSATDWTTPWLSAYAGAVLLDARAAGIAVDDSVLARLGRYLDRSLVRTEPAVVPVARWYTDGRARLSERVMAVDYLSRAGARDRAAENELLRLAPQLAWEDRARLALVLARGGDADAARRLLEPLWASVRVEGKAATLPAESRRSFYFESRVRPAAYLLGATLAIEPDHRLVGPLVETLVQQERGEQWYWNTQDYGTAVEALAAFYRRQRAAASRGIRVRSGGTVVLNADVAAAGAPVSRTLAGLVSGGRTGRTLRLTMHAAQAGPPAFYSLTVTDVPRSAPVRPDDRGIQVERWYERLDDGRPITSIAEGELVRVRLRLTVPAERHFVILDDPLPAGLEAVDLSLRTVGGIPGPGAPDSAAAEVADTAGDPYRWAYGSWDGGWWSPFDHKEIRDDRVIFVATRLWPGSYTATYVARATTPGTFVRPPAHAEEMYNPAVFGRSDGGTFVVTEHE